MSVWKNERPNFVWRCTNAGCERCSQEWMEQKNDPTCQWCRKPRAFVCSVVRGKEFDRDGKPMRRKKNMAGQYWHGRRGDALLDEGVGA